MELDFAERLREDVSKLIFYPNELHINLAIVCMLPNEMKSLYQYALIGRDARDFFINDIVDLLSTRSNGLLILEFFLSQQAGLCQPNSLTSSRGRSNVLSLTTRHCHHLFLC